MEYTIRVEATHGVVKDLVLDDLDLDNKVACRAAVSTGITLSTKNNLLSVVNSDRDIYLEFLSYSYSTLAVTIATRVLYNLTCTTARLTASLRLRDAEHRLLLYCDIAATTAGATGLGS